MPFFRHLETLKYISKNNIHIISFPKSGNTYLRILLANLILIQNKEKNVASFEQLNKIMPEFGRHTTFNNKNLKLNNGLIVKSHNSIYSIFSKKNIFIQRKTTEVYSSYLNYYRQNNKFFFKLKFLISTLIYKVLKFNKKNALFVDYDQLTNEPLSVLKDISRYLNIHLHNDDLIDAIKFSRKEVVSKWKSIQNETFIEHYRKVKISSLEKAFLDKISF